MSQKATPDIVGSVAVSEERKCWGLQQANLAGLEAVEAAIVLR